MSESDRQGIERRDLILGAAALPIVASMGGFSPASAQTQLTDKPSYHLVAPELLPGLGKLPSTDYDAKALAEVRKAGLGGPPPPLSTDQQTVQQKILHIPSLFHAPDVRVLIYLPPGAAVRRPAYLDIHGGGYILGAADASDALNRTLALQHNCVVLSVDYRLAPETRYPGQVEDCYTALTWLHSHADELGIDRARIAIGGASAGGGLAASLALFARKRGGPPICLQVLMAPMLDDRTGSSNPVPPFRGDFIWTPASNRFGWRSLLGVEPGGPDVPIEAAPGRAHDLSSLPPAFISVGVLDLFLDENMDYMRRLANRGVPAELHVIPGAYHGFGLAGDQAPQVREENDLRNSAIARGFQSVPH